MQANMNILILSDIHQEITMFEKLKIWFEKEKEKIDVVIILGDFDDLFQELKVDIEICQKSENMIKEILQKLEFLKTEIFFIPGNHDPLTLFKETNVQLIKNSMNLHKCQHYLTNDLKIVGLGGSIPAFKNNKLHWVGYPYLKDEDMEKDLEELKKFVKIEENVQTIMLTHVGPYSSQTANDLEEDYDATIFAGSQALDKFLFKQIENGKILCNIHGHTHNGKGMNKIHGIQIINPGPFKAGNFAIVQLIKSEVLDLWQIYKTEFINLLNYKF